MPDLWRMGHGRAGGTVNGPQEGFMFSGPDGVLLFFRYVRRYRINGRQERVEVLRRMVAKKKARYLRDVQAVTAGKRILKIKRKDYNA